MIIDGIGAIDTTNIKMSEIVEMRELIPSLDSAIASIAGFFNPESAADVVENPTVEKVPRKPKSKSIGSTKVLEICRYLQEQFAPETQYPIGDLQDELMDAFDLTLAQVKKLLSGVHYSEITKKYFKVIRISPRRISIEIKKKRGGEKKTDATEKPTEKPDVFQVNSVGDISKLINFNSDYISSQEELEYLMVLEAFKMTNRRKTNKLQNYISHHYGEVFVIQPTTIDRLVAGNHIQMQKICINI